MVSNYLNKRNSGSNNTATITYFINNKITIITMIYFFKSSRKDDKLKHPVTVCTYSKRRAFAMALINFKKNGLKGSPEFITI